jgi:hypothetical protein
MSTNSIYHPEHLGGMRTIRLNLRAVRTLLPEHEIEDFDLSQKLRDTLQRRLDKYVSLGGQIDTSAGMEAKPEHIRPARIRRARPARMVGGVMRPAESRRIIPAQLIPAKPGNPPSIDHLPSHQVLDQMFGKSVLRFSSRSRKEGR